MPPCIACNDATGDAANNKKGLEGCITCEAPTSGDTATCTACLGGFFGTESDDLTCTACTDLFKTCKGANNKCTSCKDTNPYFKKGESNDGTGTCVTEAACKQGGTHFPTTTTDSKKICTLCNDASNGGVDGCKTCTPKVAASLAETPSVTCSVCTTEGKKPNEAGTKCFDY